VTVVDTLLFLHVLHQHVDAHLASGGEEVSRLPERFVERLPNLGFSSRILRDVTPWSEWMNLVRSVVGFAVKRM